MLICYSLDSMIVTDCAVVISCFKNPDENDSDLEAENDWTEYETRSKCT